MRAIIFDCETTGLVEPEIIEAAWLDAEDPLQERNQTLWACRLKPSKPIELGAMATHHILPCDLEGNLPSSTFLFPDGVQYIVGHNVDFDWIAAGSPEHIRRIDTCAMCRVLYPGLDSYSQSAMCYHLFGATPQTRYMLQGQHSAKADVLNCAAIYSRLLIDAFKFADTSKIEEVWAFSEECRVPSVMPFGKWKDAQMCDVPEDYRNWYRRCTNPPPDEYILKAFQRHPVKGV